MFLRNQKRRKSKGKPGFVKKERNERKRGKGKERREGRKKKRGRKREKGNVRQGEKKRKDDLEAEVVDLTVETGLCSV